MKMKLGVVVAVLAFCCALLVGPASQARAADCTTQGALALALADVLGIEVTAAQEAADALAVLGIAPTLGWDIEACLSDAISLEIRQAFALLNRDMRGLERALDMVSPGPGRDYPVSPAQP